MPKVCHWNSCGKQFDLLENLMKHIDDHVEKALPQSIEAESSNEMQGVKRKRSEEMISIEAVERWKKNNSNIIDTKSRMMNRNNNKDTDIGVAVPMTSVKQEMDTPCPPLPDSVPPKPNGLNHDVNTSHTPMAFEVGGVSCHPV